MLERGCLRVSSDLRFAARLAVPTAQPSWIVCCCAQAYGAHAELVSQGVDFSKVIPEKRRVSVSEKKDGNKAEAKKKDDVRIMMRLKHGNKGKQCSFKVVAFAELCAWCAAFSFSHSNAFGGEDTDVGDVPRVSELVASVESKMAAAAASSAEADAGSGDAAVAVALADEDGDDADGGSGVGLTGGQSTKKRVGNGKAKAVEKASLLASGASSSSNGDSAAPAADGKAKPKGILSCLAIGTCSSALSAPVHSRRSADCGRGARSGQGGVVRVPVLHHGQWRIRHARRHSR